MRTLAPERREKVQQGIWIFVSQHKFTIVDLQNAFYVYVCAQGRGDLVSEKLEKMRKKRLGGGTGVRLSEKGTPAKSRIGGKKSLAQSLKLFFLLRREFGTCFRRRVEVYAVFRAVEVDFHGTLDRLPAQHPGPSKQPSR